MALMALETAFATLSAYFQIVLIILIIYEIVKLLGSFSETPTAQNLTDWSKSPVLNYIKKVRSREHAEETQVKEEINYLRKLYDDLGNYIKKQRSSKPMNSEELTKEFKRLAQELTYIVRLENLEIGEEGAKKNIEQHFKFDKALQTKLTVDFKQERNLLTALQQLFNQLVTSTLSPQEMILVLIKMQQMTVMLIQLNTTKLKEVEKQESEEH